MIRFPITDLLKKQESYFFLLHILHPHGLGCPRGYFLPVSQRPCDCTAVVDDRCRECGTVFNRFTGTMSEYLKKNKLIRKKFAKISGPVNFPVMARSGSAGLGHQPHPTI